jgi:NADH dehydrogenase FAD-containing subunit
MKHLVLAGGGHAHVEVLRRFGARSDLGHRLTVIGPDRYSPYSGMLRRLSALMQRRRTRGRSGLPVGPACTASEWR